METKKLLKQKILLVEGFYIGTVLRGTKVCNILTGRTRTAYEREFLFKTKKKTIRLRGVDEVADRIKTIPLGKLTKVVKLIYDKSERYEVLFDADSSIQFMDLGAWKRLI